MTIFFWARRCSSRMACRPSRETIFSRVSMAIPPDSTLRSGFAAEGGFELGPSNGGGAALHHNDSASIIGKVRGFEVGGACGDSERKDRDNRVPSAGNVDGCIRAIDGYVARERRGW